VGPTENPEISRITISVNVEGHALDQVIQQLDKLVNVIDIIELPASTSHQVELILVRVALTNGAGDQRKIEAVLEKYGALVVETTAQSLTIQQTAKPADIEALIGELTPFGIMELTQSGVVAMGRTIKA
jgi:acetolactate synthase-1/3 small subunit